MFWINSLMSLFIRGQKNFKFHAGFKICHFGNFPERAGMGPQKVIVAIAKSLFVLGVSEYLGRLESKIKDGILK